VRLIVTVVLLAACGAPTRGRVSTAHRPAASPAREVTLARPDPVEREQRIVFSERHQRIFQNTQNRRRLVAQTVDIAESDLWSPCLRDFVRAQSEPARRSLTMAFARLEVDCDQDGRVVLGPPHGYRGRSHLGYRATFAIADARAALTLAVCGAAPPSGEQIVLEYDGRRLPMARLDFERDRDGCYVAELPPSMTLARTLPDVLAAEDVVVRFGDTLAIEDLAITHEMLRDIRLVYDAVDAVAVR